MNSVNFLLVYEEIKFMNIYRGFGQYGYKIPEQYVLLALLPIMQITLIGPSRQQRAL